jgi:hypothetical protein
MTAFQAGLGINARHSLKIFNAEGLRIWLK